MVTNYSFVSFPQNAVVMSVSDGKRQMTVTEPVGKVTSKMMTLLKKGDLEAIESFLVKESSLKNKLDRSALVLENALRQIDIVTESIDKKIGIMEYFELCAEKEEREITKDPQSVRSRRNRVVNNCLRKFLDHIGRPDETLDKINPAFIREFDEWLRERNAIVNTRQYYIRRISAFYYRAVKAGLVLDARPFEGAMVPAKELGRHSVLNDNPLKPEHIEALRQFEPPKRYADVRRLILAIYDRGLTAKEALIALDKENGDKPCLYPDVPRPIDNLPESLRSTINNHIVAINRLLGLPKGTLSITHLKALNKKASDAAQAV